MKASYSACYTGPKASLMLGVNRCTNSRYPAIFRQFVTSLKLSYFSSDTSYLSIRVLQASCTFSSHFLTKPKGISVRLIIKKSQALGFSSQIFNLSSSFFESSSLGISHYFVIYFKIPLCIKIALFFSFHSTILDVSDGFSHLIYFFFDA